MSALALTSSSHSQREERPLTVFFYSTKIDLAHCAVFPSTEIDSEQSFRALSLTLISHSQRGDRLWSVIPSAEIDSEQSFRALSLTSISYSQRRDRLGAVIPSAKIDLEQSFSESRDRRGAVIQSAKLDFDQSFPAPQRSTWISRSQKAKIDSTATVTGFLTSFMP